MFNLNWINNAGWDIGYLFPPKEKQVTLVVNSIVEFNPTDLNIFLSTEPDKVLPGIHDYIKDNYSKFDYVITPFEDLLGLPNARKLVFYSPWITEEYEEKEKKFELSFLSGWKNWAPGHKLRHIVLKNQSRITIPRKFQESIPKVQSVRLDVLFQTSQFNLAIENVSENNFFTEKVIDCFLTKTIPVYWGCPNIGDFFCIDGIILFGELNSFYDRISSLTPDYYNQHLYEVQLNYNIVKQMTKDIGEAGYKLIDRKIDELLEEKFGHS